MKRCHYARDTYSLYSGLLQEMSFFGAFWVVTCIELTWLKHWYNEKQIPQWAESQEHEEVPFYAQEGDL